jgi:hypothetical protein
MVHRLYVFWGELHPGDKKKGGGAHDMTFFFWKKWAKVVTL